jgi:hypothetical protein
VCGVIEQRDRVPPRRVPEDHVVRDGDRREAGDG